MFRPSTVLAACALVLAPLGAVGDAAPSGGKVVRVERRAGRGIGTPRYCQFSAPTTTSATCVGHSVEVGEAITIITGTAVIGQLHVTHVTPDTSCGAATSWTVDGDFEGDGVLPTSGELVIGVVDGGIDPRRARAVAIDSSPSGRQTDNEYYAFDADGDGVVDLAFDHYMCDPQGAPSQAMTAQCVETWGAAGRTHELRRLRIDVTPQC